MHTITKHEKEYPLIRNIKNMLKPQHKLLQFLSICILGVSGYANSATDSDENFVDSVHEWGAWELGLEPAAGGPSPSSNQALVVRGPGVNFRPNENSAFAPVKRPVPNTPFDATTGTFTPGLPISSGSPADNWR